MIPTTPERNTPENDIVDEDSSLVLSPLYNDNNVGSDEYQMKGYGHGLSSKKKVDQHLMNFNLVKDTTPTLFYADKKQTTRNVPHVNNDISDLSLETGRNEEDNNRINDEPDVSALEHTVGKTLEQLDVNKPLANKIQPSGKTLDISSPEKHHLNHTPDENDLSNKRQKIDISQPTQGNDSPAVIEMMERQTEGTPELEPEQNIGTTTERNIFNIERSSPTSSNHMLSPIIQTNDSKTYLADKENNNDEQDTEFINMVSRRNMELSEDIHQVNIKMNNLAMDYQKLSKKYQQYQDKITDLNKELELANIKKQELHEENDNQQKSIEPLKIKLKEFVNEIKMLNSNQTLLQKKYDTISLQSSSYEKEQKKLEETINDLNKEIAQNKILLEQSSDDIESHKNQLRETKFEYEKLQERNESLTEEKNRFETDIHMKDEQILELQETLEKLKTSQDSNSSELLEKIKTLSEEHKALTDKLSNLEEEKQTEMRNLIEEADKYKKTADELSQQISDLSTSLDQANEALKTKDQTITELNKKLDESNDECNVRIAEVTELNIEIESLKESKIHLEEANNRLQEELNASEIKTQNETDQYKKTSAELESVQLKNSNIETQYLKEIGDLQSTIAGLGDTLENAQKSTDDTIKENDDLKKEIEQLKNNQVEATIDHSQNDEIIELKSKLEALQKELNDAKTTSDIPSQNKNLEIETLKEQVENWKMKLDEKEKDTNKRLRLLAEDLYHQYSSKHEQKVKSLKKSYEKKYETQIEKLTIEQQALKEEIERINKQLHIEREEKRELLRTMEDSAK